MQSSSDLIHYQDTQDLAAYYKDFTERESDKDIRDQVPMSVGLQIAVEELRKQKLLATEMTLQKEIAHNKLVNDLVDELIRRGM